VIGRCVPGFPTALSSIGILETTIMLSRRLVSKGCISIYYIKDY
jgi:hypothetical protein